MIGFAWVLSPLGVYVRDIGQATSIFTTIRMFLSPLFYPVSALPKTYEFWLQLNPLTFIIKHGRNVLMFGKRPNWIALGAALATSLVVSAGAFWWFQKT